MEKPKLEDFWLNQEKIIFLEEAEKKIAKIKSNIVNILLLITVVILVIILYVIITNKMILIIFISFLLLCFLFSWISWMILLEWILSKLHENKFIAKIANENKLTEDYKNRKNDYEIATNKYAQEQKRIKKEQDRLILEKLREVEAQRKKEIRRKKDFWQNLNWYDFEKEIEILFQKDWFDTKRTKWSWDWWIDIFLFKDGKKYVVQCKNHKKEVWPNIVRDLYGVLAAEKADKAMLINSGWFTKGVHDFSRWKEIVLWDIDDILKCSSKHNQL